MEQHNDKLLREVKSLRQIAEFHKFPSHNPDLSKTLKFITRDTFPDENDQMVAMADCEIYFDQLSFMRIYGSVPIHFPVYCGEIDANEIEFEEFPGGVRGYIVSLMVDVELKQICDAVPLEFDTETALKLAKFSHKII